jgi:hypothetical protein
MCSESKRTSDINMLSMSVYIATADPYTTSSSVQGVISVPSSGARFRGTNQMDKERSDGINISRSITHKVIA